MFRLLSFDSRRKASTVRIREGLAEAISETRWVSIARTASAASLPHAAIVRDAFKQCLLHHLERTSRHVFSETSVGSFSEREARPKKAKLEELLNQYPGLALIWEKQVLGWSRFVGAFFHHVTAFLNSCDPDLSIIGIETDLSDPHRNGRSVIKVALSDRSTWYYKPRSGRQEAAWSRFIETLNSAGVVPALRAAEVRVCRSHCWMADTRPHPCGDARECEKCDKRKGGLLYLAHIFRAVDLHAGNVVVCGEHPVLVDCESFFHPETKLPVNVRMEDKDSLRRTGMFVDADQRRHRPETVSPRRSGSRRWSIRISESSRNDMIRGFEEMHEFLLSQVHNRTLKRAQERLQRLPTRYIYRPTTYYERLLYSSLAADLLSEPKRRIRFLRCNLNDGVCSAERVRSEISQLLAGDIPIFAGPSARPRRLLTRQQMSRALREMHS